MDALEATAIAVKVHVSALSGFSVEFMAEDLQTWTKAYKEDKSHIQSYAGDKSTKIYT